MTKKGKEGKTKITHGGKEIKRDKRQERKKIIEEL